MAFARQYNILLIHDAAYSQVTFDGESTIASDITKSVISKPSGTRVKHRWRNSCPRPKTTSRTKGYTVTVLSSPMVVSVKDGIIWTGGAFIDVSLYPKIIEAYHLLEFIFLSKTDESCMEGLANSKQLDLVSNTKSTVTLMS